MQHDRLGDSLSLHVFGPRGGILCGYRAAPPHSAGVVGVLLHVNDYLGSPGRGSNELAAAVSGAGALGGFGGTDSSPDELRKVIRAIRQLRTDAEISDAFGSCTLKALCPVHSSELHHLFPRLS